MMNKSRIQKIIKLNDSSCPDFHYENPLLDRRIARTFSKSIVKSLNNSSQNSNINKKLRMCMLEYLRKICQNKPEGHISVDDNVTSTLLQIYNEQIFSMLNNEHDQENNKNLDGFLIRKLSAMQIDSNFQQVQNPEVIQALMNLCKESFDFTILKPDIIHWNKDCNKTIAVLNDIWMNTKTTDAEVIDEICMKLTPSIEQLLLKVSIEILRRKEVTNEILLRDNVQDLIGKCSISANCFQLCCNILNSLFIRSKFNPNLQVFIELFVKNVHGVCKRNFTSLYPAKLQSLVLLLNIDCSTIPESLYNIIVGPTLCLLKELYRTCEHDVVMLLSHYSQWFDLFASLEEY